MRAAKAQAAIRGESLKELFERAVASELGRPRRGQPVTFPLIRSELPPVTEADIAATCEADSDDDDLRRAFG